MKKGTIAIVSSIIGAAAGVTGVGYLGKNQINQKAKKVDKFKGYYNLLNQWLMLKQEGVNLSKYFEENNYKTIAIYGMGEMGNRLYEELKDTGIEVKYAVDKNAASAYSNLEILEPDDEYESVDAIIVTAVFAFDEIEKELQNKVDFPIISLEDVVFEC